MVDVRSNWEELNPSEAFSHMFGLKVPGGWLVYVDRRDSEPLPGFGEFPYTAGGLTFYPDPNHEWDGGSLPSTNW